MKPYLFFFFLLLIPLASALYGGEDYIKHFDECDLLGVIIEGDRTIDDGEYIINNNNCINKGSNTWLCNCTDDYIFNVSFKINTVNDYNITFDWNYSEEDTPTDDNGGSSSGGGSSGGGSYSYNNGGVKTLFLKPYAYTWFSVGGEQHRLRVKEYNLTGGYIILEIYSDVVTVELTLNKSQGVDVDGDGTNDWKMTLKEFRGTISLIEFEEVEFETVEAEVVEEEKETETTTNETIVEEPIVEEPTNITQPIVTQEPPNKFNWWIPIGILMVIAVIGIIIYLVNNNEDI